MKLKIRVSKEVLKKSKFCTDNMIGHNCAIAIAVRELLPNCWVGRYSIIRSLKDNFPIANLPKEAIAFINYFDLLSPEKRVLMPEMEFEIEVAEEELTKNISINEVKQILEKSETLELIEN